jgi:hypothetical protein
MTITARHAERRLTRSIANLTPLAATMRTAVERLHLEHADQRPAGAEDRVRRKGWITDPTGEAATSRMTTIGAELDDLEGLLDTLNVTARMLAAWIELRTPVTTVAGPRCGDTTPRAETLADWYRPDCTEQALGRRRADGTWSWDSHGLCAACYHRRRRAQATIDGQVA